MGDINLNNPLPLIKPQCNFCRNWTMGTATCKAYPERIPKPILLNQHDHAFPFEGDHNIRFEKVERNT